MKEQVLIYNKLVRDLIPERISDSGKCFSVSTLDDPAFADALRLKLLEESHELFHADSRDEVISESADLLELIDTILKRHGVSWAEVEQRRIAKRNKAGGFEKRLMLHATATSDRRAASASKDARLPQLLTSTSLVNLVDVIKRELADASALHIASAFYSPGMLNLLLDPFISFLERGGKLRLLTSVMGNFNNPHHLQHLQTLLPPLKIRIFYPLTPSGQADFTSEPPPFHIKGFLFEKPTGQHSIIVGSSNLTGSGLGSNHEWNYFSNSETNLLLKDNLSAFQSALKEYNWFWERSSVPIDNRFLEAYLPRWEMARKLRRLVAVEMEKSFQAPAKPRPAQEEALRSLAERRANGIRRTTVIAATGLGKTYLAAFDFRQSGMKTVLFIAHRENILTRAMETFRNVMEDASFGELLSGNARPKGQGGSLFAMVQTLSQPETLESYGADAFDYIVVDEFHHASSDSYHRLLSKFRPKFLLGLTATPERMDGRDVLKICDYDVAYETRLFDAIENRWLVPFHYFAIYDKTDYSSLHWTSRGGYVESELDQVLMHDTRAELVFNNLRKFLPSTGKVKALAFCSSRSHADFMNRKFNDLGRQYGMGSLSLLGDSSIVERDEAMKRLQDENDPLQIICSVDIFGEGVDIPAVSHVLFLRPTQSFTVFLQQLGRGLRHVPEKDFLVALDFVGNFRQSYVAPLALSGYTSVERYKESLRKKSPLSVPPAGCAVSVDTEVRRIWDADIERTLTPRNRLEALKEIYQDLRSGLGESASIMDFFANPAELDPYMFLKAAGLGGNWLRVKSYMGDLTGYEESLLDTPGELFLQHLEKELSPAKSYKMVVLKSLLALDGVEWPVEKIAEPFLRYYLENRSRLRDFDELAREDEPDRFPLSKVTAHLMRMPLDKLQNTGGDFFVLDRVKRQFGIRPELRRYWLDERFRDLVADRVEFGLARYFYRKEEGSTVGPSMRGVAVQIPYATRRDQGYTGQVREVIAANRAADKWECVFEGAGYTGKMDIEVQKDEHFVVWTSVRYDDPTRFPSRIKAAATALFEEGLRGEFQVHAEKDTLSIVRQAER